MALGSKSIALAIILGVPIGIGAYTVHYAGGTSYLSTDPQACANCHIMSSQLESWQKASHHTTATCVDCHIPEGFVGKYVAKAVNGYNHSKAFTFQDFHEPIMINEWNSQILQENCERCHGDLLHPSMTNGTDPNNVIECVHCHRSVGHGEWLGLGGPDRGDAGEREN